MPNGDAVTTPIMHPADFLTESFLSCIKDKQEKHGDSQILKFSQKEREKGTKREKRKYKEKKFIVNSFLLT